MAGVLDKNIGKNRQKGASTIMDKESTYLLQLIDCNCNNCIHMERDFVKFKYWEDIKREVQREAFEKAKAKAIAEAEAVEDESTRRGMLRVAHKMTFQFDRSGLLSYGNCLKFQQPVSFIPAICQIETQGCFEHRKSNEV